MESRGRRHRTATERLGRTTAASRLAIQAPRTRWSSLAAGCDRERPSHHQAPVNISNKSLSIKRSGVAARAPPHISRNAPEDAALAHLVIFTVGFRLYAPILESLENKLKPLWHSKCTIYDVQFTITFEALHATDPIAWGRARTPSQHTLLIAARQNPLPRLSLIGLAFEEQRSSWEAWGRARAVTRKT